MKLREQKKTKRKMNRKNEINSIFSLPFRFVCGNATNNTPWLKKTLNRRKYFAIDCEFNERSVLWHVICY